MKLDVTSRDRFGENRSSHYCSPRVSVLLPVFNGESYIAQAVESILCQSYGDLELIIIDDGSTDATFEIVRRFTDKRIRLFRQPNLGLPKALNRAIGMAQGELLARQDADDISMPMRLEKQVRFLDSNPDYGIVGTWSEIFDEERKTRGYHQHPSDDETLRFCMLFNTHFVHTSVMFRRDVVDVVGVYATEPNRQPQDFELWSRVVRSGMFRMANVPEILVRYREVPNSISRNRDGSFAQIMSHLCAENLAWASSGSISDPEVLDAAAFIHDSGHALSPGTNVAKLLDVLLRSAYRIGGLGALKKPVFREEFFRRLDTLTRNYLIGCYGTPLGSVLFYVASGLLRFRLVITGKVVNNNT